MLFTEKAYQYIPTEANKNWGPEKPFVVKTEGYFFFLLSTTSTVKYTFEIVTQQVYVNESDYEDPPQYFTGSNYSFFSYGKCFKNGGFKKESREYVTR